ncbi:MAG TPA: DUF1415 domain-containing protein [Burkholderiaceae bacterium]|nr:DUF1415 domain-containing protein [Burkholderiaceae bacterium]
MVSDDVVLAATRRWLEEAVIGLNLCPFAKSVYVKNQVRIVVSRARHIDAFLDDLDRELELLKTTPAEEVETTLLVHPTLFPDFLVFNDFLNVADEVLVEHELEGVVQIAPFHPDFVFDGEPEGDMSHYTNRSPYPTLHLIREEGLGKAIDSYGNTDEIYERNIDVLRKLGPAGWR